MSKENRGALEISFGWLFAIIVGAFILFLAIYFSVKLFQSESEVVSAKTGKEISILLNPLEISFESAKTISVGLPAETRINSTCSSFGDFGSQSIQLSQKSFNKWTKTDVKTTFYNKYIFSEEQTEGKTFYFFSKPFDFPFKTADLIYMTSAKQRYCFIDAPPEVEEEISALNQSNLLTGNCLDKDLKVCFEETGCDIDVDYYNGVVEKDGKDMSFVMSGDDENSLMYAAIFSSPKIYECQVKRLMLRLKELALLYNDKEIIINERGCGDNMGSSLTELSGSAGELSSSEELTGIKELADNINSQNDMAGCLLW